MIKTKQIQYTPQILFKNWLQQSSRRLVFLLIIFFLLLNFVYYHNIENYISLWYAYAGISLVITLFLAALKLFLVWRAYTNKNNKAYYKPFHQEFDEKFIKTVFKDGANSSIPWNDVFKATIARGTYRLYIAKNQAFILTEKDFQNSEDFKKFEELLKSKKLLNS